MIDKEAITQQKNIVLRRTITWSSFFIKANIKNVSIGINKTLGIPGRNSHDCIYIADQKIRKIVYPIKRNKIAFKGLILIGVFRALNDTKNNSTKASR